VKILLVESGPAASEASSNCTGLGRLGRANSPAPIAVACGARNALFDSRDEVSLSGLMDRWIIGWMELQNCNTPKLH